MVEALETAPVHLEAALDLLDSTTVPSEIGALVDMAAERLRGVLGADPPVQIGAEVVATAAK